MRHARSRVDGNHAAIVKALRDAGCSVQSLADIGKGCPDILVGLRCHNWTFEIKDPAQPPSKRQLTGDESVWHSNWRGQVHVIETVEQALAIIAGQ